LIYLCSIYIQNNDLWNNKKIKHQPVIKIMKTMQIIHHNITFDRSKLEQFCLENGIAKLSLFGSVLRDDFGSESDIDMLVEFITGRNSWFYQVSSH